MLLLEVVLRGFEHRSGVITCVQLVKGGSAVRVGQGLLVGLVAVLGWGRLQRGLRVASRYWSWRVVYFQLDLTFEFDLLSFTVQVASSVG
jgi:hypothetical protein